MVTRPQFARPGSTFDTRNLGNFGAGTALSDTDTVNITVTAVNDALEATPELVNTAPYTEGWMYELELAEGTDLLILATPYGGSVDALRSVRHTDGKAVIDISNPLNKDMSGLVVGHTTSAAVR